MRFDPPLLEGRLIRRYQRFLVDVETPDGVLTAHCPNTGSMQGCLVPGSRVWVSPASNPARKLAWTWELVETAPGVVVGVHTGRSNALVHEALEAGLLPELVAYGRVRPEVRYGQGSRVDFLLQQAGLPDCYLEVKNVTAAVAGRVAAFPDAVTERGRRHLEEMAAMVAAGQRAVLVFCVQREDVDRVRPADEIDPAYGRALREAVRQGVEVRALRAEISPQEIRLVHCITVDLM